MNSTTKIQKRQTASIASKQELTCVITLSGGDSSFGQVSFDALFLEAVDVAFSLLGEPNKQMLFRYLSVKSGLGREAIPYNLGAFEVALEQVFGQGALLLEVKIMQFLHSKVPETRFFPNGEGLYFVDYCESLRRVLG